MWNKEASQDNAASGHEFPAAAPRPETERRLVAWVGKSVVFKGELISSEDMTIDGRVEGIIELRENTLTVGRDAKIHADIAAKTVIVHGTIVGSVTALEKVVLGAHAVVEGDVLAARVGVADGAVLRGRIETTKKVKASEKKEPERELVAV